MTRVSVVDALRQDVTNWQQRAHADSRLTRGRKVGDRILLAEWVGLRLDEAGIRLTVSNRGRWARTLPVVYEAARIEPVPEDLFRDVQQAYDFLQNTFPERFPQRTKLRHKRKKSSRFSAVTKRLVPPYGSHYMAAYRELLCVALDLRHKVTRDRDRLREQHRRLREECRRLRETRPRDTERGT